MLEAFLIPEARNIDRYPDNGLCQESNENQYGYFVGVLEKLA